MVKQSICQCRRLGFDLSVRKIPWRRKWQPSSIFLPEKFHGQRSLVGYSPRGHEEEDLVTQQQQLSVWVSDAIFQRQNLIFLKA